MFGYAQRSFFNDQMLNKGEENKLNIKITKMIIITITIMMMIITLFLSHVFTENANMCSHVKLNWVYKDL